MELLAIPEIHFSLTIHFICWQKLVFSQVRLSITSTHRGLCSSTKAKFTLYSPALPLHYSQCTGNPSGAGCSCQARHPETLWVALGHLPRHTVSICTFLVISFYPGVISPSHTPHCHCTTSHLGLLRKVIQNTKGSENCAYAALSSFKEREIS